MSSATALLHSGNSSSSNNGRNNSMHFTAPRRSLGNNNNNTHNSSSSGGSSSHLMTVEENHIIALTRPNDPNGENGFGFTIRGGIEHGLGHFVSSVEPGSEAHLQGLRPGDQVNATCIFDPLRSDLTLFQIITVDGMLLRGSTHREAVTLISSRNQLTLGIKSTGVIPVKDHRGDPVSWRPVERPAHEAMIDLKQLKMGKMR